MPCCISLVFLCVCAMDYIPNTFHSDNLRSHLDNWKLAECPQFIRDWICNGISLPLNKSPPSFDLPNHVMSNVQKQFVNSKIKDLVKCGVLSESINKPFCISPLGCVSKRNNKFRLITDLRSLNSYIDAPKIVYEGIDTVKDIIQHKDHLVTLDLKNGFFHIPISEAFKKYLGVRWNNKFYVWNSLPFGLSCSPYYFCKVVRSVVTYLRKQALRIVVYVDDFLLLAKPSVIADHTDTLVHTLQDLGFVINLDKSNLQFGNC